jgi:Fic family protein
MITPFRPAPAVHLRIHVITPIPYHQGKFPPDNLDWQRLIPLIGPANGAIARYEGMLHGVPNPDVLLAPLSSQEAVLSSRIEGTQTTLGEVLEFGAATDPQDESTPRMADIHEVLNYQRALLTAVRLLDTLPLSQRLIRETHAVLMRGVRGRNKAPGDYRRIPTGSARQARRSRLPVSSPAAPTRCPTRWTPGNGSCMHPPPTCWCSSPSRMRNSRQSTLFSTAMGDLVA